MKRYPIRIPHAALGIRAQDLRTLVRKAWWARRWLAALEAMRLGARLGRGRAYAVNGQVDELLIDGPHVAANVVGSREAPYHVTLDFTALDDAAAARVAAQFRKVPMLAARTLTNDLPTEVEAMFRSEGIPLFPAGGSPGHYDVTMRCSCPDWARPCKHLVAVMLLLGEEITRRPALLLALRGFDMNAWYPPAEVAADEPLPVPVDTGVAKAASAPGALLRRLGPIPFWRGVERCGETLERIMARVQPLAKVAANGEPVDLRMADERNEHVRRR